MWGVIMIGCYLPLIMVIRNHLNIVMNKCFLVFVVAFFLNVFLGNESDQEEAEYGQLLEDYPGSPT